MVISTPEVSWETGYNPYGYRFEAAWKNPQRNRSMRGIKTFIILAVAAFHFSVMTWCKGSDQLCWMPSSFKVRWNKVNVSLPEVEKRFVNSTPLSV